LNNNPEQLRKVLSYHIVAGEHPAAELKHLRGMTPPTGDVELNRTGNQPTQHGVDTNVYRSRNLDERQNRINTWDNSGDLQYNEEEKDYGDPDLVYDDEEVIHDYNEIVAGRDLDRNRYEGEDLAGDMPGMDVDNDDVGVDTWRDDVVRTYDEVVEVPEEIYEGITGQPRDAEEAKPVLGLAPGSSPDDDDRPQLVEENIKVTEEWVEANTATNAYNLTDDPELGDNRPYLTDKAQIPKERAIARATGEYQPGRDQEQQWKDNTKQDARDQQANWNGQDRQRDHAEWKRVNDTTTNQSDRRFSDTTTTEGRAFRTSLRGDSNTIVGTSLTVTARDNALFVNNARVVKADIEASNGVIHAIDKVILPRNTRDMTESGDTY
jgi:uncharacterized surface protein with fasciclin (FAS1) repeats